MLETALANHHRRLGARMAPFAGYLMPVQYASVKEEVLAVRRKAGLFDVSHMGEFFVEGPDAERFVDFLLCNDFLNAAFGKALYSPLCNRAGGVVDDLIAYKLAPGRTLLCVNAANIDKDWAWISSHPGFDVGLSNRSSDYSLLALQGPGAEAIGARLGWPDLGYYSVAEAGPHIIARTGYTGEDGFEIFSDHASIKALWERLVSLGATPCGLAARDVLRLEAAYPLYGRELSEERTPFESGLGWTVKLDKGGFVGKEALTRHRPNLRLVKLALDKGIARSGYPVKDAHGVIGHVTSGTFSVTLGKGVCLALVSRVPGDKNFLVEIRQKDYPAQYFTRPFVKGGHK